MSRTSSQRTNTGTDISGLVDLIKLITLDKID